MADAKAAYSLAELTKAKLLQYSGMRRWLYAVSNAKRNGTQLNIVCALDSLTANGGGSSYIDFFRPRIQKTLGAGGLGFVAFNTGAAANENNYSATPGIGASGGTTLTNNPFDPATNQGYDPNLYGMDYQASDSAAWFNIPDNSRVFTKATVWYLKQPSGGTFKFGDGSFTPGLETVNTANATKQIASYTYSGTFPSVIGNKVQAANFAVGPVHLIGAEFKNGNTGVRVHRLAQGGTTTQQVAQLDGASYTSFLQGIGCDLFIVNGGMNDASLTPTPRTDTQYEADMRTLLTRVRNANPNCAILIVAMNETSDNITKNPILETYRKKLQLIAQDYEAMYMDNRWVMGTYANASGKGWMADGTHPGSAVNPLIANAIFNAIGGDYLANIDQLLLS